jgi:hypothetical protein
MTDPLDLVRGANPVPELAPLPPATLARITWAIVARERRVSRRERLRGALRHGRFVAIAAGMVLLAGGTAAAVVALTEQPSAPPSGTLRALPGVRGPLRYHLVLEPDLSGGSVGWCLFGTVQLSAARQGGGSCGDVQLRGRPLVAIDAAQGASIVHLPPRQAGTLPRRVTLTYEQYAYLAYVTAPTVAAVRVDRGLTIRTRRDPQLPNGYRIAVWLREHLTHVTTVLRRRGTGLPSATQSVSQTLPSVPDPSAAVGLDARGRVLGPAGAPFAQLHLPGFFWQAQRSTGGERQPSRHAPGPGACEIDTARLGGVHLFFGSVVARVTGFPQLAGRTFTACAETRFATGGLAVDAAILVDAQHPGSRPAQIAAGTAVRAGVVNVPASTLGQPHALTARRAGGDAWLAIEAGGTLAQRIAILDGVRTCVHVGGPPCPAPR